MWKLSQLLNGNPNCKKRQRNARRRLAGRRHLIEPLERRELLTVGRGDLAEAANLDDAAAAARNTYADLFGQDYKSDQISIDKNGELRKVGLELAYLHNEHKVHNARVTGIAGPLQRPDFEPRNQLLKVSAEKVLVDVTVSGDTDQLAKQLSRLGMDITGSWQHVISGLLPIDAIDDLAGLSEVVTARPFLAQTASGSTVSQGDVAQLSDDLRTQFGLEGSGITVGVLSDSFDSLQTASADITTGDLPGVGNPNGYVHPVNVVSENPYGGSDEGRAMLQVIHDVAPAANLAFATAALGQAAFAQNISDLRTVAGADIIVDDILYFAEPFFQDGILAQAADAAYANGVAYISAAGNNSANSYEADFAAGTFYSASAFSSLGSAPPFTGGTAHDFDAGSGVDDLQGFSLNAGQSITLSFQWDQPFASVSGGTGAATDMDIFVVNDIGEIVAGAVDYNTGADPVEILQFTNDAGATADYQLLIVKREGPDPGRLKYVNITNGLAGMTAVEFATDSSTLYGHANTAGALAVGAVAWNETPEFGTSPPELRSFSSVGGTAIRLDAAGNSLVTPVVHEKPDLVAPDGGNNTFFGTDSSGDADAFPNFTGTSAAAAHAAGAAALMLGIRPGTTPDELYTSLRDTAVDLQSSGFDFASGYGLLDAFAANEDLNPFTTLVEAKSLLNATTWSASENFVQTTTGGTAFADELVRVDSSKSYELTGWARSGNEDGSEYNDQNRQFFGFESYDIDLNAVKPYHVLKHSGAVDTTVAEDLIYGATELVVEDATGWYQGSAWYHRNLAWYGYTDSTGYIYPDYTYTQNVIYATDTGAWTENGITQRGDGKYVIQLSTSWTGATLPQGTAVRNTADGGAYQYSGLSYGIVPNAWTEYTATISGVGAAETQFRPGVAYIRPILLPNFANATGNRIEWRDVEWNYQAPEPYHGGDHVDLHVNTVEFAGPVTYDWTQTAGPTVTLVNDDQPTASFTALVSLADHDLTFEVTVSDGATVLTDTVNLSVQKQGAVPPIEADALLNATTWSASENFVQTTTGGTAFADELVRVDSSKSYELTGWARSGNDDGSEYNDQNRQFFGFESYDIDLNAVKPYHVLKYSGSVDTTVAEDLIYGATELVVEDATGWYQGSAWYHRNLAWYGYTDSTGYTYPDYSYTRNVIYATDTGAWAENGITQRGDGKYVIQLATSWSGATLPQGTAVRNTADGGTYQYSGLSYGIVPNAWTEYTATISGVGAAETQFRPGVAYIRPILLPNFANATGNRIEWRDVEWNYQAPEPYHGGDHVDLHVNTVEFAGPVTYDWTQTAGPTVTLVNDDQPTASFTALVSLADHDLTFEVTVSDGATVLTDTVNLNVQKQGAVPPIEADALLNATTWSASENFVQTTTGGTAFADELVRVDSSKSYELTGWARSGNDDGSEYNDQNRQFFGFESYDIDLNAVKPYHVLKYSGSVDTTVAEDLIYGATELVVEDATGWYQGSAWYHRNLAWYGYTDSTGYTYPDYSYTRNVIYATDTGAWAENGITQRGDGKYVIQLATSWSGATLPQGTAVRNTADGGTYQYSGLSYGIVPNAWTEYTATISGVGAAETQFRPGVAYIRPILLPNFANATGNRIEWRDVEWNYQAPEPYHGGDHVDLHVNTVEFAGPVTYDWTQTAGPTVTLVNVDQPTASFTALTTLADHELTFDVTVSDGASSLNDSVTVSVTKFGDVQGSLNLSSTFDTATHFGTLSVPSLSFPNALTYEWVQTGGLPVELDGADTTDAGFIAVKSFDDYDLTFDLIVSDGKTSVTDGVTINVPHIDPQVQFRLETTDLQGAPIGIAEVGQQFRLNVYVRDVRPTPTGVFAAYLDVAFDSQLASAVAVTNWGSTFGTETTGTAAEGMIDEGGGAGTSFAPTGGGEFLLYSSVLRADTPGTLMLVGNAPDALPLHNVLFYNQDDSVPLDEIDYGSISLEIDPGGQHNSNLNPCGTIYISSEFPQIYEGGVGGPDRSTINISSDFPCKVNVTAEGTGYTLGSGTFPLVGETIDSDPEGYEIFADDDADSTNGSVTISAIGPDAANSTSIIIVDDDGGGGGGGGSCSLTATGDAIVTEPQEAVVTFTAVNCTGNLHVSWSDREGDGADFPDDFDVYVDPLTVPLSGISTTISNTPAVLRLDLVDDTIVENTSQVKFIASIDGETYTHTVTIDDDGCDVSLSANPTTIDEGNAHDFETSTITVTAWGSSCGNGRLVSWTDNGGDGVEEGVDYGVFRPNGTTRLTSGSHNVQLQGSTFGNRTGELQLRLYADSLVETQTSYVRFSASGTINSSEVDVNILDDDGNALSELQLSKTDASEPASYYFCNEAINGSLTISAAPSSSWGSTDLVTLRIGGDAIYQTDYVLDYQGGQLHSLSNGYLTIDRDPGATEIVIVVLPLADADEVDDGEMVEFELLTAAGESSSAAVVIHDELEQVTIRASDPDAAELNQDRGTFVLEAPGGQSLCTHLRLIIDASVASSATPHANAPLQLPIDYSLERVDVGPIGLDIDPHLYPGSPPVIFQATEGGYSIFADDVTQVVIDVIPAVDSQLEGVEIVKGQVEALRKATNEWFRPTDSAEVTIVDDANAALPDALIEIDLEPDTDCSCSCTSCGADDVAVDLQSGSATIPIVPGILNYTSEGTHGTQPVVRGQFKKIANWPSEIEVTVEVKDWAGILQSQSTLFTLDTNGYSGDAIAFAVPMDLEGLPTGSYRIKLIGIDGDNPSNEWTAETSHYVINRWDNNDIAPGIVFPFLNQAISGPMYLQTATDPVQHDGIGIVRGDNSVSWFRDDTTGNFLAPAETVSTLESDTLSGHNLHVLTDRFGNTDYFAATGFTENVDSVVKSWTAGQHYKHLDRNGNETLFVYDDFGRLEQIIDPLNRKTVLSYGTDGAGNFQLTITDFANRETIVTYDETNSTLEVLHPDPDHSGNDYGLQPKDTFEYDGDDRLIKITRHAGGAANEDQVTHLQFENHDYGYSRNWGRLASITRPDGSTWTLQQYRQAEALPDPYNRIWQGGDTVPVLQQFENLTLVVDGRGNLTTYKLDHRGRGLRVTDSHGQITEYDLKLEIDDFGNYVRDRGEITSITTPDPDDFSSRNDVAVELRINHSLASLQHKFEYDELTNITKHQLPSIAVGESSVTRSLRWPDESADPDGGFVLSQPKKFINELGQVTEYSLAANGNVDAITVYSPSAAPRRGPHGAPAFQNALRRLDVNGDGTESSNDALVAINELNASGAHLLDPYRNPGSFLVDANGDNYLNPSDVLHVINFLNNASSGGSSANPLLVMPNDYTVSYTYTPDSNTDSFVNGLLESQTVTTGRSNPLTTRYDYYDGTEGGTAEIQAARFGLLESVTYSDGTTLDATVKYEYDEYGNLNKITDELNRVTQLLFDRLNRLVKVTSSDPDDLDLSVPPTSPEQPLVIEYQYDAFGNVVSVTQRNFNPLLELDGDPGTDPTTEHTTCFYYDNMDRIEWIVEPHPTQNTAAASCDVTGTLPDTGWAGRPVTHYSSYDGSGNLVSVTDAEQRTTSFEYDDLNRLTKIVEPTLVPGQSLSTGHGEILEAGPVTTFMYDNVGNMWMSTDALGNTTDYRYDEWNRPTTTLEPMPEAGGTRRETKIDYIGSQYGWIYRFSDAEGRMTDLQTDFLGRTTYIVEPAVNGERPMTWFEYFDDGQLKNVTDPNGNVTQYTYDDKARLKQIIQPEIFDTASGTQKQPTNEYSYDDANQLLSVTDPLGRITAYAYDLLGRTTLVSPPDPDGQGPEVSPTHSYRFDAIGNLLESTDALGHSTIYEYDLLFRNTKTSDANGDATTSTFDLVNNLLTLTDANSNTTTWHYDGLNRPYSEENALADERRYLYDAVGNLRKYTDRNGREITYDYDNLYRRTQEQWGAQDPRTFTFEYDLVNNLKATTDTANTVDYTFEYDALDRVTFERHFVDDLPEPVVTLAHDYDLVGNRASVSANFGGSVDEGAIQGGVADFLTSYQYDALHRLTNVTQNGDDVSAKHVTFGYDVASQLTDVRRFDAATPGQNLVAHSLFGYDAVGRVTTITHSRAEIGSGSGWDGATFASDPAAAGTDQIAAYALDYDAGNRLEGFASWRDLLTVTYDYDNRNQLTSAVYASGNGVTAPFIPASESYAFDGNGNRTSANGASYQTGADNQLESVGADDYEYDGEGNRESKDSPEGHVDYTWDHRNRLTSVVTLDASWSVTKTVAYEYDVFDRRIEKRVDYANPATQDVSTIWVYDGAHVALEFTDADGAGNQEDYELSHRYLYGAAVDMILADEQITSENGEQDRKVYWPLTDHLGSVRDVVERTDDNNPGTFTVVLRNHVLYNSFGDKIDGATTEAVDFLFGFTAREWDEDVELQYNRARWYDPEVARFISQDPIGFEAGDANLYRYVGNETTVYTDPSGNTMVAKGARKLAMRTLKRRLKSLLAHQFVQIHHVIPQHLFKSSAHGAFLQDLGFLKNQQKNLIALPTRYGKLARIGSGRSVHDGCHLRTYFKEIDDAITKLSELYAKKEITKAEASAGVMEFQKNMRTGLREGTVPLQSFHQEYLGAFVLAGMSEQEVVEFAELMAERAAAEMDVALDGHGLNYLRAQGYTGKDGVFGWLGFGVDFFNPFDLVAMLGDVSVLLNFDPMSQSAEEFLDAAAKNAANCYRNSGPVK